MKSQSLSEELLARSTKIPLKQGTRHLKALFAAHREEIGDALRQGWNMSQIWNVLHSDGRYPGSYSSFNQHCAELLKKIEKTAETPEKDEPKSSQDSPASPQPETPPSVQKDWSIKGAEWKPGSASDKSLF